MRNTALRHEGKVAMVTGGSNGIGRAIVQRLASEGARVAIVDVADGAESVALVRAVGGEAIWVPCDLADDAAVRSSVSSTRQRLGEVSIFVHSAAVQFVRPF